MLTHFNKAYSLMHDEVFKNVIGNSDMNLSYFLTAFLNETVSSIILLNNEIPKNTIQEKQAILDTYLLLNKMKQINIEMQKNKPDYNFVKRTAIYGFKLIVGDLKKGKDYADIVPVVQLILCNFNLFNGNQLIHTTSLFNETKNETLDDCYKGIYVELPKVKRYLNMKVEEMDSVIRWMIYIKYRHVSKYKDILEKIIQMERGIAMVESTYEDFVIRGMNDTIKQIQAEKYENEVLKPMRIKAVKEGEKIGQKRGERIGERKKQIELTINLLKMKFPDINSELIASLSFENAVRIFDRILELDSIQSVEKLING